MTELEFKSLAQQGYNRIPLIAEAFADLETPLTLYLKLAQTQQGGKNTFLLESVVGGERFGRYSFIGLPATTVLRSHGKRTEIVKNGVVIEEHEGNPLDFIEQYQSRFKVALRPGMPRFCGGLAGYFGYDTVRHIEKKLAGGAPKDDLNLPDIQLMVTEELAVIDNLSGKLYLIVYADTTQPESFSKARQRLKDPVRRATYLCELHGQLIGAESDTAMPADFLMQQMEWREALDEADDVTSLQALADEVQQAQQETLHALGRSIDQQQDYVAAAQQVRRLMFVQRFAQDVKTRQLQC